MWATRVRLSQGRPRLYKGLQDRAKSGSAAMGFKIKYTREIISSIWRGAYRIQDGFLEEEGFALGLKG